MFSTPLKLVTDVEYKKGDFGVLVRAKAWYDDALNERTCASATRPTTTTAGVRT